MQFLFVPRRPVIHSLIILGVASIVSIAGFIVYVSVWKIGKLDLVAATALSLGIICMGLGLVIAGMACLFENELRRRAGRHNFLAMSRIGISSDNSYYWSQFVAIPYLALGLFLLSWMSFWLV